MFGYKGDEGKATAQAAAYKLLPVKYEDDGNQPAGDDNHTPGNDQPGVFRIELRSADSDSHNCLTWRHPLDSMSGMGPATSYVGDHDCEDTWKWPFHWRLEPVGAGDDREVNPAGWDPWTTFDDAWDQTNAFYIRPLHDQKIHAGLGDRCLQLDTGGKSTAVAECGEPHTALTLHQTRTDDDTTDDDKDPGEKSDTARERLDSRLLGGAFAASEWACRKRAAEFGQPDCKVRLADRKVTDQNGDYKSISDWSRFGQVSLNTSPTTVVAGTGCAGGAGSGGAQAIYNSGDSPVTTTISASASNSASSSVTEGITIGASFGLEIGPLSASVEISKTTEYGRTFSETEEVSQDVSWTIPPRRYATAVIATDAVNLAATWQFGPNGGPSTWRVVNGAAFDLPYSTSAGAVTPDTTLNVYNSWSRKDCNASQPSTLADGRTVSVANSTAPGKAPVVGDALTADVGTTVDDNDPETADDPWWEVPAAGDDAPVKLRYQWYRVRNGEPAEPIPGAVGETELEIDPDTGEPEVIAYTVTGDDVTDPEVLDRFGPYHIYVGVTDVADETRFDSLEYTSVATGGVTEGPRRVAEGHLDLEIANPDTVATKDTRVDIAASITGGDERVDGDVTILDGEEELRTVSLGSDGTRTVWLPLTTGPHDLTAVYEGEGPLDGVRSSTVRTTVTAAPSSTGLTARGKPSVGADTTLRADVKGAGPTPTGTVEFFDGVDSLGDPVELNADGTAELVVPGVSVGGSREVWATYLGDDVYAESRSEAVRQIAARAKTTTRVKGPRLSTAHRQRTRLKSRVSVPGPAVPSGKVVFVADGRKVGVSRVNARGVATVRTRRLPLGRLKVWARFIPSSGSGFAASRSTTLRHQVRRHRSWVRGQLRDKRVRKRERVQVRGRVVLPNRRRMRPLRGKIELVHDGRRYSVKRIKRDGTYRVGMPARRLDKGRNVVKVVYHGSKRRSYRGWKRRSIAADTMRVVVRRR